MVGASISHGNTENSRPGHSIPSQASRGTGKVSADTPRIRPFRLC